MEVRLLGKDIVVGFIKDLKFVSLIDLRCMNGCLFLLELGVC